MVTTARIRREFGDGPLSRLTAVVYTVLVVEGMLLLSTAPGLVVAVLLARDASNLPLYAACALPVGPGLSAALVTLDRPRDATDLHPAATFLRAYRANARDVLALWTPLLAAGTIIGISLAHRAAAGLPAWWTLLLVVIGVVALLWGANVLMLASFFSFRHRDTARLGVYFLLRTPGVTLATGCLLVVAVGIVAVSSEAVLALLGSLLALMMLTAHRPLIATATEEFTG